jgi:HEAT repeat protein
MHVRIAALEAVGAIGGASAADILLPQAAGEQADAAAAALRALGGVRDPRVAAALKAALRGGDASQRLAAVTGLRACASAEAVEALEWTAAADPEDSVGLAALEALGTIAARDDGPEEAAVAALIATLAEPARRGAAAAALARLPERRIPDVAAGLGHASPAVRRTLIDVLARLRHPTASAAIRGALDDAEADVREAAITALDQLGVRGLGPRLARMAREDGARRVRRTAASALGRTAEAAPVDDDGTR